MGKYRGISIFDESRTFKQEQKIAFSMKDCSNQLKCQQQLWYTGMKLLPSGLPYKSINSFD
jgi:hypothetical protein